MVLASRGQRDRSFEGADPMEDALDAAIRRQARRVWVQSVTGATLLSVASFVVAMVVRH